jgi:superfamily I DNA/RNA helicase
VSIKILTKDVDTLNSWRGSKIGIFKEIAAALPSAQLLSLTESFRSNQAILDASRRLIAHNRNRLETSSSIPKALSSMVNNWTNDIDDSIHPVRFTSYETVADEDNGLAEAILKILDDHKVNSEPPLLDADGPGELTATPPPSIAVLVKTKQEAADIYKSLRLHSVPVSGATQQLKDSVEVQFLLNFLQIVANPTESGTQLFELVSSGVYA